MTLSGVGLLSGVTLGAGPSSEQVPDETAACRPIED